MNEVLRVGVLPDHGQPVIEFSLKPLYLKFTETISLELSVSHFSALHILFVFIFFLSFSLTRELGVVRSTYNT